MKLKICSFEIAKILKELKANIGWSVFTYDVEYEGEDDEIVYIEDLNIRIPFEDFKSDLRFAELALVQMWFRETHNIDISPIFTYRSKRLYHLGIIFINDKNQIDTIILKSKIEDRGDLNMSFESYDDALEAGILEAIKLIKTKQDG